MKKSILILSLSVIIATGGLFPANAQEQPKPKKDTVNIDTDAKPTFYYPVEDEKTEEARGKSPVILIAIIVGVVVVVTGAAFLLLKKRNKEL